MTLTYTIKFHVQTPIHNLVDIKIFQTSFFSQSDNQCELLSASYYILFHVSDNITMSEVEEALIEWLCSKDDDDTGDINVAGAFSNWEKLSMSKIDEGRWGIR